MLELVSEYNPSPGGAIGALLALHMRRAIYIEAKASSLGDRVVSSPVLE